MEHNRWTQETSRARCSEFAFKPLLLLLSDQFIELESLWIPNIICLKSVRGTQQKSRASCWMELLTKNLISSCYSQTNPKEYRRQHSQAVPWQAVQWVTGSFSGKSSRSPPSSTMEQRCSSNHPDIKTIAEPLTCVIPQLGANPFCRDPSCSGVALVCRGITKNTLLITQSRTAAGAQDPEQQLMGAGAEQFCFSVNRQVSDTAQFLTLLFLQF